VIILAGPAAARPGRGRPQVWIATNILANTGCIYCGKFDIALAIAN
jgi:hypothetical protein